MVAGEAGIGKSRLVDEFSREVAADPDVIVAIGQCVEFGTVGLPYVPIAGLIRGLADSLGMDAVLDAAGAGAGTLRDLIDGAHSSRAASAAVDRLDEVVTNVLERLSAERPVVVIIEDLHWADPATLDVLRVAARVLRGTSLLIVMTYRSDDVGRGHPLRGFLADLDRNRRVTRIDLGRLTAREVRAQAHDILGAVPTPDEARRLFERSDGVPFFVEELLAHAPASAAVSPSLRELLLARYETQQPLVQRVARALAAGGSGVEHDLLADVVELPDEQLEPVVREAVEAGLIVVTGRGYDFRHALVREAVGGELLPGERRRYHSRYAEVLGAADLPASVARAFRIAHHWYEAHAVEQAFSSSLEGMRLSLDSFAYASAAQLGERALGLWDSVASPDTRSGENRVLLMERTAHAWRRAGEPGRALATVELALSDPEAGAGAIRARLLRDKGLLLENEGRGDAIPELEAALDLLRDGDERELRAEILVELAAQYMVAGRGPDAIGASGAALEAAPHDAHRSRSFAANIRGGTLLHQGHIEEGLADYDLAFAEAGDDYDALLRYYINRSDGLYMLGRFAESVELAEAGLAMAAAAGVERTSGAILAVNTVDPLYALGEWERADRLIDESLDLDPPASFRVYLQRAKVRSVLWRGDPTAAHGLWRGWARFLAAIAEHEEQARASQALDVADLLFAMGDLDGAWEVAGQLVTSERVGSPPQELPLTSVAARVLARRRQASGDRTLHADEESRLRAVVDRDVWPTQPMWRSFVDAELGGDDGAGSDPALWLRAREAATSPEAPVINVLLVELGLARAQVVAGERTGAVETLERLRMRASDLGAGLVVQWADELTESAGLVARPRGTRADFQPDALTPREQQVLALVAEGLTNVQIAERLYLSRKTVSVHVSAVLRKLGASTRTEAVRLAAEQGDD